MGSDSAAELMTDEVIDISIHAPRVGSDKRFGLSLFFWYKFQSTLPVWGATANMHKYIFATASLYAKTTEKGN